MPTRYSEDWAGHTWNYPQDLAGFLAALGTSMEEPAEARVRVGLFLMLPVAKRLPPALRRELLAHGLLAAAAGR